jgi:hypothetical protein
LAVAAAVEAVTVAAAATAGGDGRDPGVVGELGVGRKPGGAGDLADQLGRGQWAAADLGGQPWVGLVDERRDLSLELADVTGLGADRGHHVAGDPHAHGLVAVSEAPPDTLQPDGAVERAGGDVEILIEVVQMPTIQLIAGQLRRWQRVDPLT